MSALRSAVVCAILSGIAAFLALPPLVHRSNASVASLALGTDDAFAAFGLEPRENQIGGGALRWTRPNAAFQFEDAGPGLVDIRLEARDHRGEVTVTANGALVGALQVGERRLDTRVKLSGGSLVLEVATPGFKASGRTLGTQVVSIEVKPQQSPGPRGVPVRLWMAFAGLLVVSMAAQLLAGRTPFLSVAAPLLLLVLVLPGGLWRSGWLLECAVLLGVATVTSTAVAAFGRGAGAARAWLQVALLVAITIHGLLPPSPLMIQGDAQLHGNKLGEVARGNWFPISRTDHRPPFDFPYGVSFYGVLSPFASPEVSNVRVVRLGAAFFWSLSLIGLAVVLGRASAGFAALSVILWTFAPVNIKTMAFGNLSNVFAQSIFVLFLVATALMSKGVAQALFLTLLVTLSATAHLSSFIVLVTLLAVASFVSSDRHSAACKPLLAGVLLSGAYYLTFLPMVVAQVPRLLGERGGSSGVFDPWRLPAQILSGVGWPLLALMSLSLLVMVIRPVLPMSRSLLVSAVLLALVALVSPIEVRYLLAAMPAMAVVGAAPFHGEDARSFPGQTLGSVIDSPWLRRLGSEFVSKPLAVALAFAAVVHGVRVLLEFLPLSGA